MSLRPSKEKRFYSYSCPFMPRSRSTREDPYLRGKTRHSHDNRTQIFVWGTLGVVLTIWFFTPVSNCIVGVILCTVPVESDIKLGREACRDLQAKYKLVRDK